jgi:phage-related protein
MANLFQAIYDFLASIVELIVSTFSTIFHTLKAAAEGFLNLLFSFVKLFEDVLKGAIDVVGGVGKFVVGAFNPLRNNRLIYES